MAQSKKTRFMTGRATLAYAYLTTPDTAFDPNGVFKTDFKLGADDAKALVDAMKAVAKEAFGDEAPKVALPYKVDKETGEMTFKTKSKYQCRFVDATGKNVEASAMPPVYGGSEARIAGNIHPYNKSGNKGLTLQLTAVQVISLAERQGGSGFDAVEDGGFTASNDNEPSAENGASYNF